MLVNEELVLKVHIYVAFLELVKEISGLTGKGTLCFLVGRVIEAEHVFFGRFEPWFLIHQFHY